MSLALQRIRLERSNEPMPNASRVALVRRRLLHGEELGSDDVDISPTHLFREVSELKKHGYNFERTGKGPSARFRLTNPEQEPQEIPSGPVKRRRLKQSPLLRAVLAGESMTSGEAGRRFNIRPDSLRLLVGRLEERGYSFHRIGSPTVFQLEFAPNEDLVVANKRPVRTKPDLPAEASPEPPPEPPPPRVNGVMHALAPHPVLGSSMLVHMLAMTDDGDIQVGLKSESGESWLLTIDGYHSPS